MYFMQLFVIWLIKGCYLDIRMYWKAMQLPHTHTPTHTYMIIIFTLLTLQWQFVLIYSPSSHPFWALQGCLLQPWITVVNNLIPSTCLCVTTTVLSVQRKSILFTAFGFWMKGSPYAINTFIVTPCHQ